MADPTAAIARRERIVRRLQEIVIAALKLDAAPEDIDPDAQLLGGGLELDSVDALELIVWIEREYGVRIEDEQVGRVALRSLNTLADLVLVRLPAGAAAPVAGSGDAPA